MEFCLYFCTDINLMHSIYTVKNFSRLVSMLTTIFLVIFHSLQMENLFESLCDVRYFPPVKGIVCNSSQHTS